VGLVQAIRRDTRWEGPRLALLLLGLFLLAIGVAIAIAIGPAPLSRALGGLILVALGVAVIAGRRAIIEVSCRMWGINPDSWFGALQRLFAIPWGILACAGGIRLLISAF
jgi:hypothetical protein